MNKLYAVLIALVLLAGTLIPVAAQEGLPPSPVSPEAWTRIFVADHEDWDFREWNYETVVSGNALLDVRQNDIFDHPPCSAQSLSYFSCAYASVGNDSTAKAYAIDRTPTAQTYPLEFSWYSRYNTGSLVTNVDVLWRFVSDTGVILAEMRGSINDVGQRQVRLACRDYNNPASMKYTTWVPIYDDSLYYIYWNRGLSASCDLYVYDHPNQSYYLIGERHITGINTYPYGPGKELVGLVKVGTGYTIEHFFDLYQIYKGN